MRTLEMQSYRKDHSLYLIHYMRGLLLQEENRADEIGPEVRIGGNDKYLIKKLKQYNINSEKVEAYLQKVRQEELLMQRELEQFQQHQQQQQTNSMSSSINQPNLLNQLMQQQR